MSTSILPRIAASALCLGAILTGLRGQFVYLPDTNFRAWMSNVAPGSVDSNGYLDTTHAALNIGGHLLHVDWPNSDLTGIEYLHVSDELYIEFVDTTGAAPLSAWPAAVSMGLYNLPWSTLPALPPGLLSLGFEHCMALTALPTLPAGLAALALIETPALAALPVLPNSLVMLRVMFDPLLSSLPALPGALEILALIDLPALGPLPVLPTGLLRLDLDRLPLLTTLQPLPPGLEVLRISDAPSLTGAITVPALVHTLVLSRLPQTAAIVNGSPVEELVLDSLLSVDLSGLVEYSYNTTTLRYLPNLTTVPVLGPDTVQTFIVDGLPLSAPPQLPVAHYLRLANMPAMTTLPPWPVDPYNCAHLTLDGMDGITQLPSLPLACIGLRLKDLPNLYCLPPLPNNLVDLFIEGSTPITCLPNDFDNNPGLLPMCGVLDSCDHLSTAITGRIFWDQNTNGTYDAGDMPFPFATVWSTPGTFGTGPDSTGMYWMGPVPGNYTVQAQWANPYVTAVNPTVHTGNIPTINAVDSLNDFAFQLTPGIQDLVVDVTPNVAVPGFMSNVWINVTNMGTTSVSGSVVFDFGTVQTWAGSTPPPDVLTIDQAIWNFSNLAMADALAMHVTLHTDSTVALGTPYTWTATADPVATDQTPLDNQRTVNDSVVAGFDPNDKHVLPTELTPAQVIAGERVTYTIRFQNTGTYLAQRVVLMDTLSGLLEWNSMVPVAASHEHTWYIHNGVLHVVFDNILLPDSTTNEPGSHGFFKFSMRPVSTLILGDAVENTANIYFDFNQPVITNAAVFSVSNTVGIAEEDAGLPQLYPNPATDQLTVLLPPPTTATVVEVLDALGRVVRTAVPVGPSAQMDVAALPAGVYHVRVAGQVVAFIKL